MTYLGGSSKRQQLHRSRVPGDSPVLTLRPVQMTSIDLPATSSHLGGTPKKRRSALCNVSTAGQMIRHKHGDRLGPSGSFDLARQRPLAV
jgi:hypothetical protein